MPVQLFEGKHVGEFSLKYLFFREKSVLFDEYSCLKCCIFTKLSRIVCLIIIHILVYQHARCDRKLWNALWFYCVFLWIFIHFWRLFIMSEVLFLHQTFTDCMSNQYTHFDYWHARCNYKLRKVLWKFQRWICYSSSNFHKFCGKVMKIISTCHLKLYISCHEYV